MFNLIKEFAINYINSQYKIMIIIQKADVFLIYIILKYVVEINI